jgi:acyl-CoA synthetase (AMP-forming)/AMP-acid ligase II
MNVALRLAAMARRMPFAPAVIEQSCQRGRPAAYRQYSFRELETESDRIARGLRDWGVTPGTRLALFVPAGFDFVSIVFGLFKAGAVAVLIDPGMGRKNLLGCLRRARPDGFIAVRAVHLLRRLLPGLLGKPRFNVTVGSRAFRNVRTLGELKGRPWEPLEYPPVLPDDPAAVIFTSGSTGLPKGVVYRHANFDAQVRQVGDQYGLTPGGIDVAAFPLFALFDAALGAAAVFPQMDFSRPANVDPGRFVDAILDLGATQAFASPAVWKRVGPHCVEKGIRLESLRTALSAGAPVHANVLAPLRRVMPDDGEIYTPYGATEALPVSSIGSAEVLGETSRKTEMGGGVCVGRRFAEVDWRVIPIGDFPLEGLPEAGELPPGQIGELIVRGPAVTREYFDAPIATRMAKIPDGESFWHRMGDVGYLDDQGRFWFCGRMSQRVATAQGTLFTIPAEGVFNSHPRVSRSALVGVGRTGRKTPVIIIEPRPGHGPRSRSDRRSLRAELLALGATQQASRPVAKLLFKRKFPVDTRHNAKIFREKLARWARWRF